MKPSPRLALMIPAAIALLTGLNAALLLIGLPAPLSFTRLATNHGSLLVLGFVGTLIALERATALKRWYGYLAPALLGLGSLIVLADSLAEWVGQSIVAAGAAIFTYTYVPLWRRRYDGQILVQLLGAACAFSAAIMWIGDVSFDRLMPWLTAFVVLTIAAERVELASITLGAGATTRLLWHAAAIAVSLIVGVPLPHVGAVLLGLSYLSLALWLVRHDVARHTIRATGSTRFMAACMLAGYVWLIIAGAALLFGFPTLQRVYDAFTHAIFLGFTFSMIMAHASTILPAVLHIKLPYRSIFWIPAVLLHLGLAIRVWIGDAFDVVPAWQWGGALSVLALLLFFAFAIGSAVTDTFSTPKRKLSRNKPTKSVNRD